MWDTLAEPWRACVEQAWLAACAGSIPCGAAIVGGDGTIVARGRNRVNERRGDAGQLFGTMLAHAEMNALVGLDLAAVRPSACVMYATTEPCNHCAGAILVAQVGEVHFASRDPRGGRVDLLLAHPQLRPTPLRVVGPERDDLEIALMDLGAEYWLRSGRPDAEGVLASWAAVVPGAVRLGRVLRDSTEYRQLRERGAAAGDALDAVAFLITTA